MSGITWSEDLFFSLSDEVVDLLLDGDLILQYMGTPGPVEVKDTMDAFLAENQSSPANLEYFRHCRDNMRFFGVVEGSKDYALAYFTEALGMDVMVNLMIEGNMFPVLHGRNHFKGWSYLVNDGTSFPRHVDLIKGQLSKFSAVCVENASERIVLVDGVPNLGVELVVTPGTRLLPNMPGAVLSVYSPATKRFTPWNCKCSCVRFFGDSILVNFQSCHASMNDTYFVLSLGKYLSPPFVCSRTSDGAFARARKKHADSPVVLGDGTLFDRGVAGLLDPFKVAPVSEPVRSDPLPLNDVRVMSYSQDMCIYGLNPDFEVSFGTHYDLGKRFLLLTPSRVLFCRMVPTAATFALISESPAKLFVLPYRSVSFFWRGPIPIPIATGSLMSELLTQAHIPFTRVNFDDVNGDVEYAGSVLRNFVGSRGAGGYPSWVMFGVAGRLLRGVDYVQSDMTDPGEGMLMSNGHAYWDTPLRQHEGYHVTFGKILRYSPRTYLVRYVPEGDGMIRTISDFLSLHPGSTLFDLSDQFHCSEEDLLPLLIGPEFRGLLTCARMSQDLKVKFFPRNVQFVRPSSPPPPT